MIENFGPFIWFVLAVVVLYAIVSKLRSVDEPLDVWEDDDAA